MNLTEIFLRKTYDPIVFFFKSWRLRSTDSQWGPPSNGLAERNGRGGNMGGGGCLMADNKWREPRIGRSFTLSHKLQKGRWTTIRPHQPPTRPEKKTSYLVLFVRFSLIPIAIGVLVVHQEGRPSIEHPLLALNVLAVQVVGAVKVAQTSLHSLLHQILCDADKREKV